MIKLDLYEEYSRKDAHEIFSPETKFTPQAGTWGLQGPVQIPNRPGDYVFFVTFGKTQSDHTFDEGITEDGILSWQSQIRQTLEDERIKQWIDHDEFVNNIYLFLRTAEDRKYAYLGRLKYISHDREREKPVWFQWQILDWSLSVEKRRALQLELQNATPETSDDKQQTSNAGGLVEVEPPSKAKPSGKTTLQFKGKKSPDYSIKDAKDRKLGRDGELAILAREKLNLIGAGRADLADQIVHVSEIEGDGAGYDIKSYDLNGQVKYIEVKTTRGSIITPFFMSINEIRFSELHKRNYVMYRLFEFRPNDESGKLFQITGSIREALQLEAINFRAKV
jgi:Domain of unknown function (DUF3883)/Domain of unknown function (DUF3427)